MICIETSKAYCSNYWDIENYQKALLDETQTWHCHHRREISENKSQQELKNEGKYYNVSASDLIYLTPAEHAKIHKPGKNFKNKGKHSWNFNTHPSEESKKKMSQSHLGKPGYWTGKQRTEETKIKCSLTQKGRHRIYREDGTYYYSKQ